MLVPVITDALPYLSSIFFANLLEKNSIRVSIPFFIAVFAWLGDGSTPSTLRPFDLNPLSNTPTLLPMSMARESGCKSKRFTISIAIAV